MSRSLPYPARLTDAEWAELARRTPPNVPAYVVRHGYAGVRLHRGVMRRVAKDEKRGALAFRKVWEPKFYWKVVK